MSRVESAMVTAILRDFREQGIEMFSRFTVGKEQGAVAGRAATEWYYEKLVEAFDGRKADLTTGADVRLEDLRRTVSAIKEMRPEGTSA